MSETSDQPVAEEPIVSPEAGVADEAHAQGDDQNLDTGTGEADNLDEDGNPIEAPEPQEEDHEEIEHEGQKYKVPKALKESFLRQADYTRKTQEVADQRRSIETERQAWEQERAQQAEFVKELRAEIGTVERLAADLKAYDGVDWRAAQTHIAQLYADPNRQAEAHQAQAQYNLAWNQFTALERDLSQAKAQLTEKEQRLATEQTRRVQAGMAETFATLEREVPGFNPDLAAKIVDHGMKAFGLKLEEAQQIADPRVWKLLHSDHAKSAEIAKLQAENAKLKGHRTAQNNNQAAQQVKPATQVRGAAPATGAPRDDMPVDEWMRRERERVARKAAR